MLKVKSILAHIILPLFLFITFAFLINNSASARQLTKEERKFYAQNNIIFTVPCDSEADCEPDSGEAEVVDPGTPSGEGVDYLVDIAIKSSWPTNGQCKDSSGNMIAWTGPRRDQACSNTINSFAETIRQNSGANTLQDCGKFIGAVVRYSQLDASFPKSGVYSQIQHMESSSKWTKVSTDGNEYPITSLKPGDIIAYSKGATAGATGGHIMIYIGSKSAVSSNGSTFSVNIASASYTHWTPQLNKLTRMSSPSSSIPYSVFRYTGN